MTFLTRFTRLRQAVSLRRVSSPYTSFWNEAVRRLAIGTATRSPRLSIQLQVESLESRLVPASFAAGNLAILRADSATANNTTAAIVEILPSTASQINDAVQKIAINGTTGIDALRFSGSAGTTGYVSHSNDGSLLTFTGHNTTTSSGNINTVTARGVGTLDPSGTYTLQTTYTGTTGNQARSATSLNNSTWFIADQGGVYTNGASTASPTGNLRGIKSFGSTAYVGQSSATTTVIQVSIVSAPSGGTITGLPGLTNNNNFRDFYLIQSGANGSIYDVLYVTSQTTTTAGTLSKFSLVSGSWAANGSYTTDFGGFGLAAKNNGASGALLYVTSGDGTLAANRVMLLNDVAGFNATIDITTANNVTLYTAPTGTTVKGLDFVPVAPTLGPPQITSASSTTITEGQNGTFQVTATGSPATFNYSLVGAPGWASINSSGLITFSTVGRPAPIDTTTPYSFSIEVSNGVAPTASQSFTVSDVPTPILYATAGSNYTQNFDKLAAVSPETVLVNENNVAVPSTPTFLGDTPHTNTTPPGGASALRGWSYSTIGPATNASRRFVASDGSNVDPAGGAYSYGSADATDRALGSSASGSNVSRLGAVFVNTTAQTLNSFTLSFTVEQWHRGDGAQGILTFGYGIGNANINTGSFTAFSALDVLAPVTSGFNLTLDGNNPANQTAVSASVAGFSWAPGQKLVIRWDDINENPGNDDGLAIDNLTFSAQVVSTVPPNITSFNNAKFTGGQTGAVFTVTASGTPAPTFGLVGQPSFLSINTSTGALIVAAHSVNVQTQSYTFTVTASNGIAPNASQTFTLYEVPAVTSAATLTPGNLLVLRIGDGGTTYGSQGAGGAASSAAAGIFLDEYTTNGVFVQTVFVPTTGAGKTVESISATSDGMMTLSADGRLVTFTGYRADPGTANVAAGPSNITPRVIGTVNALGTVTTSTTSETAYEANNIRGAATVNGTQFWTAGTASPANSTNAGIRYFDGAGVANQIGTMATSQATFNTRTVAIFNGKLYWGTNNNAGAGAGVYSEAVDLPTSIGAPDTSTKIGDPTSPFQFVILDMNSSGSLDSGDKLYIVDDNSALGGLFRFNYNGSSWDTTADLVADNFTDVRGLTGKAVAGTALLYGTRATNNFAPTTSFSTSIVTLTDDGVNPAQWLDLTNPVNFVNAGSDAAPVRQFRGIAFVPKAPGAAPSNLVLTSNPTGPNAPKAQAITLNATTAAQTGWVSFLENGRTLATVAIASGTASYVIPANSLTAGSHTFNVFYGGSDTFASSTQAVTLNVTDTAATHFTVSAPTSVTAGVAFNFTVTALDSGNNTSTGYTGTVHFTSSDGSAALPADLTLVNGVGTFSATLKTPGSSTLTATDTVTGTIIGSSAAISVNVVASQFLVSVPSNSTPGTPFILSVTAQDSVGNVAVNYSGIVHFTSSDAAAILPSNGTLANGTGLFAAVLKTSGNQTVVATDTITASITGNGAVNVAAASGPATHFLVSAPAASTAGNAFVFSVTARDATNATAVGYTGTVHLGSSDSSAFLSPNATLSNGVGFFAIILRTSGNQTITATDAVTASIIGTSSSVAVAVSSLHHFGVSASNNANTGLPFNFTVAAQDQFNNTVSTYNGTVHFTSSDGSAVLPADSTLISGSRILSATLKTSGSQTLTATDTTTASITGTSAAISTRGLVVTGNTVTPTVNGFTAAFNKPFDPAPINLYDANSALGVADVVLARNAIQTITFGAAYPNNSTFSLAFNGSTATGITYTNTSTATLQTNIQNALNALVTVGSGNSLVTALSSTSVTVMFQGARGFQSVSAMTPNPNSGATVQVTTTVGGSSNLRGSLLLNSTNTGLTFLLSSTGAGGVLPADVYQATIRSASTGFKDLLGASLDGNNDGVTGDSMVTTFTVATTPTVILSVPDFARGPDSIYNVRIPNIAGEEVQTITFTGTANGSNFNLVFGAQTASGITYSTSAATLQGNIQTALEALTTISGPNDANFRRGDVLVTSTDATAVTVRFQNVMGGFDQPQMTATSAGSTVATGTSAQGINTGIPISLVGGNLGAGVTAVTFDLLYDPALLNITGAYSLTGGSSFTLVGVPSGGVAHFSYSRNAAPALGATATLGHIVANVPDSAETNFKTKQLLQLTSIVATGAAATPVGNSGVQIVAFFGDANGDGRVTGGDAALVSRVNSGTDTISGTTQVGGLGAYRMLDPFVMVALGNAGNGAVASGDVTLINSYLVRSQTQVPTPPPFSDMSLAVLGPDPTLSLPSDLQAAAGETVVVPVNIDITRPGDSPGMMEAILALRYDTKVFTVSAADIQLGSVPNSGNGWQLRAAINAQTGEIGINIYSLNPILTRGGGSLVTVSLHVREGAVAGASAINLVTAVNPTGMSEYVTSVNDSINQYIINPVITDGFDAGVDGRVTVPAPLVSTSMTSTPQFVFTPGAATAEAAGFKPFEPVQLSAVVTSDLPEVVLEEVFGDLEEAALYLAASGLGKSAALDKNQVGSEAHDLAMLWSTEGVTGQDWMSDDSLPCLGKFLRRGRRLQSADAADGTEDANSSELAFEELWPS